MWTGYSIQYIQNFTRSKCNQYKNWDILYLFFTSKSFDLACSLHLQDVSIHTSTVTSGYCIHVPVLASEVSRFSSYMGGGSLKTLLTYPFTKLNSPITGYPFLYKIKVYEDFRLYVNIFFGLGFKH